MTDLEAVILRMLDDRGGMKAPEFGAAVYAAVQRLVQADYIDAYPPQGKDGLSIYALNDTGRRILAAADP